jgi:hypothetical protein
MDCLAETSLEAHSLKGVGAFTKTIVTDKFTRHEYLKNKLIETGDVKLEEGNFWCDVYWGVCYCEKCDGKGKNALGQILMEIRESFKKIVSCFTKICSILSPMIDIDIHHCKNCPKKIPVDREYCYVCDMFINGKKIFTPKNIHDLVDEFFHNTDLSDYETEDVIALFDKFEEHINKKKYRITIQ